jgi:PAS domain S-box-containing protein
MTVRIVGLMTEMVFLLGRDKKIRYVNPSAEKILGYTLKELAGKSLDMFTPGSDAGSRLVDEIRIKNSLKDIEALFVSKTGDMINVSLSAVRIPGITGSRSGFMIIAHRF